MVGYVKCFDSNKTMSFKVSDNKTVKTAQKNMGKSQQCHGYMEIK